MALLINGITVKASLPGLLGKVYKYEAFSVPFQLGVTSGGKTVVKTVDVKKVLDSAWSHILTRAKHKHCNDYFQSLSRGKTLSDVIAEGDITLHCLVPKPGHQPNEIPLANTAGRDIALDPGLLLSSDSNELVCTLIHELAHVAGATTDKYSSNAGEAEAALQSCQCKSHYNPQNLGRIIRSANIRIA